MPWIRCTRRRWSDSHGFHALHRLMDLGGDQLHRFLQLLNSNIEIRMPMILIIPQLRNLTKETMIPMLQLLNSTIDISLRPCHCHWRPLLNGVFKLSDSFRKCFDLFLKATIQHHTTTTWQPRWHRRWHHTILTTIITTTRH